ncbi:YfhH family protein [Paenibacillus sp. S-38]|uniref:YfhH family protein n=1 Tax=Paenibacillus sp. S-38 TaxID=3416710 RepID=UPI003CF7F9BF
MKKLYSQMSREELEHEMKTLREDIERAEFPSQKAVLESKYETAKSYTLDPADFPPGLYKVHNVQLPFHVVYLNGIMAWGTLDGREEASFPLSMLTRFQP